MAIEKPRPEDRTIFGYDKQGNAKKFEVDKLPGGRLPPGFTDEPPPGKHPNTAHLPQEEQQPAQDKASEKPSERSGEEQKKPK